MSLKWPVDQRLPRGLQKIISKLYLMSYCMFYSSGLSSWFHHPTRKRVVKI